MVGLKFETNIGSLKVAAQEYDRSNLSLHIATENCVLDRKLHQNIINPSSNHFYEIYYSGSHKTTSIILIHEVVSSWVNSHSENLLKNQELK
jgi:hypothetical protein